MSAYLPPIGPSANPDPNLGTDLPNNIKDLAIALSTTCPYTADLIPQLTKDLQNIFDGSPEAYDPTNPYPESQSGDGMTSIQIDVNIITSTFLKQSQTPNDEYFFTISDFILGYTYVVAMPLSEIGIAILNAMMKWSSDPTKVNVITSAALAMLGSQFHGPSFGYLNLLPQSTHENLCNAFFMCVVNCKNKGSFNDPAFITQCQTLITALGQVGNGKQAA
jgi:hypothetical protein